MSAHQNKIPESKSKSKFQSLNINTIYQVQTRLTTVCVSSFLNYFITRALPTNNPLRTCLPNMVSRVLEKCRRLGELQ